MNQQHRVLVNNLNKYDFYEYQKPLTFKETDYRTAFSRGHQFYFPTEVPKASVYRENLSRALHQKPEYVKSVSETNEQYHFQFPFKYEANAANLTYQCDRPQFIKHFDEKVRHHLPKPIDEYQSTTHNAYPPKILPPEPKFIDQNLEQHLERPDIIVSTNTEGFSKYLDPFASTTTLDYIPYTENMQNGIAKKDAITFYDWLKYPKTQRGFGLKDPPHIEQSKILPIYDKAVFTNITTDRYIKKRMKFVPNNAFKTEIRQNYQIPIEKNFDYKRDKITPIIIPPTGLKMGVSEYQIVGSGKRLHSYLKAEKNQIIHHNSGDCR